MWISCKSSIIILIGIFVLTQSINLKIDGYSSCIFHVIDYGDLDLSNEILADHSQLIQAWTTCVHNSTSLSCPGLATEFTRQSKLNCHVLFLVEIDLEKFIQSLMYQHQEFVLSLKWNSVAYFIRSETLKDLRLDDRLSKIIQRKNFHLLYKSVLKKSNLTKAYEAGIYCYFCPKNQLSAIVLDSNSSLVNLIDRSFELNRHWHGSPVGIRDPTIIGDNIKRPCENISQLRLNTDDQICIGPFRAIDTLSQIYNFTPYSVSFYSKNNINNGPFSSGYLLFDGSNSYQSNMYVGLSSFTNFILEEQLLYCLLSKINETYSEGLRFLLSPFESLTWILIFTAYIFAGVAFAGSFKGGYANIVFTVISIIFKQGVSLLKKRRYFYMILIFSNLILTTLYENYITGKLVVPDKPVIYQNFITLLENGYRLHVGFPNNSFYHERYLKPLFTLHNSLEWIDTGVYYEPYVITDQSGLIRLFKLLAANKIIQPVISSNAGAWLSDIKLVIPESRCYLTLKSFEKKHIDWIFQHHFHETFSMMMNNFRDMGLLKAWYLYDYNNVFQPVENNESILKMSSKVIVVLALWGAGMFVGLLTFVKEIVCYRRNKTDIQKIFQKDTNMAEETKQKEIPVTSQLSLIWGNNTYYFFCKFGFLKAEKVSK